jgi:hypothetical protein
MQLTIFNIVIWIAATIYCAFHWRFGLTAKILTVFSVLMAAGFINDLVKFL